jgi:hypothetical protein
MARVVFFPLPAGFAAPAAAAPAAAAGAFMLPTTNFAAAAPSAPYVRCGARITA